MAATVIQAKNAISEGTSASIILGTAPTSGSLLVALYYINTVSVPTPGSGWTLAFPYSSVPTRNYVWSSGPWGAGYILWKFAGGGESTTQTPVSSSLDRSWAMSMFEIGTPGGTWDQLFRVQDAVPPHENPGGVDSGPTFAAGLGDITYSTGATDTCIMMSQDIRWDTLSFNVFSGMSNSVTGVATTTVAGWPIGSTPKNASCKAYYDILTTNDSAGLSATTDLMKYGSLIQCGVIANLSGGAAPGEEVVTATVEAPAATIASFRYTTLTIT